MPLYKLKVEEKEPVRIYARTPQDIIDLVAHYHEQARSAGQLDDPRLGQWVRRIPTIDDLLIVERGVLHFQTGMVDCGGGDEPFWEELQVTPDFSVYVNQESLPYFDMLRAEFPRLRRLNLYKIQRDGGLAPGLNFIPEDVMQAICRYDLTPHLERARGRLERITEVRRGHPNLA